jgi:hypothetical protein
LVLRVLRSLHTDFAMEVAAWAPAAKELRAKLDGVSFPSLWRCLAYFPDRKTGRLIDNISEVDASGGIIVPLEPHLGVLATRLSLPRPQQLPLFPPMVVSR